MQRVLVFLTLLSALCACARPPASLSSAVPQYDQLRDVREAPSALRAAARAIVKIVTADDSGGTGTFVSKDGLLLTNNHVLGADDSRCARQGCWIKIHLDYQRDVPYTAPTEVFAEPVSVSPELDASVVRIYTSADRRTPFRPSHHLAISALSNADLRGRTVHVIGHPSRGLKKWSAGRVFHEQGAWFHSTNYTLGGNSGSPYLDDEGRIVGLLHHGSHGHGAITRRGALYESIGTPGAALAPLLAPNGRASLLFSLDDGTTVADVAENSTAYVAARRPEVTIAGEKMHVVEAIGRQCDALTAPERLRTIPDLNNALELCSRAWSWLNCNDPDSGKGYKTCPADKAAWKARFLRVAELARSHGHGTHLAWAVSPWRLEENREGIDRAEREALDTYLGAHSPGLGFELAYYLLSARGTGAEYRGTRMATFVRRYRMTPGYEHHLNWIVYSLELLHSGGAMKRGELMTRLAGILRNPGLELETRIYAETLVHQLRLF